MIRSNISNGDVRDDNKKNTLIDSVNFAYI